MQFRLRTDLDVVQRCATVLAAGLVAWLLLGQLLAPLLPLLVTAGLLAALLKSSVQLEVEDRAVLVTGCDTGFGLQLAKVTQQPPTLYRTYSSHRPAPARPRLHRVRRLPPA